MRYMLIIHNDTETHPTPGGPGWEELMAGYLSFNEELMATQGAKQGEPLAPPTSATNGAHDRWTHTTHRWPVR